MNDPAPPSTPTSAPGGAVSSFPGMFWSRRGRTVVTQPRRIVGHRKGKRGTAAHTPLDSSGGRKVPDWVPKIPPHLADGDWTVRKRAELNALDELLLNDED